MTREEAIQRFNGIIRSMSISVAQAKFYPTKAELNELCDMAIEALQTDMVLCKDCKWAEKAILDEYCVECTMYHTSCMKHGYCHHGERSEPSK